MISKVSALLLYFNFLAYCTGDDEVQGISFNVRLDGVKGMPQENMYI